MHECYGCSVSRLKKWHAWCIQPACQKSRKTLISAKKNDKILVMSKAQIASIWYSMCKHIAKTQWNLIVFLWNQILFVIIEKNIKTTRGQSFLISGILMWLLPFCARGAFACDKIWGLKCTVKIVQNRYFWTLWRCIWQIYMSHYVWHNLHVTESLRRPLANYMCGN